MKQFIDLAKTPGEKGREDTQGCWQHTVAGWLNNCNLLDVGAGLNGSKERMSVRGINVTTLDPGPGLTVDINADISTVPDKSYDVVSLFDVIEHIEHPEEFVEHLRRISTRMVVMTTPNIAHTGGTHVYHRHEYNPRAFIIKMTGLGLKFHRGWMMSQAGIQEAGLEDFLDSRFCYNFCVIFKLGVSVPPSVPQEVYTYHDDIGGNASYLKLWAATWESMGWTPVILTRSDAMKHPEYNKFMEHIRGLPTVNGWEYEEACYVRWLAADLIGGLFVDGDVLNMGLQTGISFNENTVLEGSKVPCAVWVAKGTGIQKLVTDCDSSMSILERGQQHFSDMIAFQKSGIPAVALCSAFGDSLSLPMVHFSSFDLDKHGYHPKYKIWNAYADL